MKKIITDILISFGILILALLACIAMNSFAIERTYVAMVLVLAVFLISVVTDGFVYGVVASLFAVLMDNFVFAFPYMAFDFLTVENLISGLVMLVVACITCTLTSRIKVQEKMKAEAEKEKMRANLLRAVSHDLRTPLTTIYSACNLILEEGENLLENAVLHAKGMTHLSLTVKPLNDYAVFTVADDGCGIPKERLLHLFDGYMDNGDLPADSRDIAGM